MKQQKIIYILFYLLVIVGFTSCLKDKQYDNYGIQPLHSNGDKPIVEIALTTLNTSNFFHQSFNASSKDTTIDLIPVVLASASPAKEDVKVTLVVDSNLVKSYNDANGTDYLIPPSSLYTIINPGGVVTIPKGSTTGYLQVKLIPSNFLGGEFAFGFKIASVSNPGYTISGNTSTGIYAFGIKNKYDGHYLLDGTLVDLLAPANSSVPGDPYPYEADLVTTGPNSVALVFEGNNLHLTAGGGSYGEFDPVFTFDSNNNIISVTNLFGQPSPSRNRSAQLDPTGLNKYNPGSQTIDVKYLLLQAGALKAQFNEHFTYIRPR